MSKLRPTQMLQFLVQPKSSLFSVCLGWFLKSTRLRECQGNKAVPNVGIYIHDICDCQRVTKTGLISDERSHKAEASQDKSFRVH